MYNSEIDLLVLTYTRKHTANWACQCRLYICHLEQVSRVSHWPLSTMTWKSTPWTNPVIQMMILCVRVTVWNANNVHRQLLAMFGLFKNRNMEMWAGTNWARFLKKRGRHFSLTISRSPCPAVTWQRAWPTVILHN